VSTMTHDHNGKQIIRDAIVGFDWFKYGLWVEDADPEYADHLAAKIVEALAAPGWLVLDDLTVVPARIEESDHAGS
jgi:hypothetical protein